METRTGNSETYISEQGYLHISDYKTLRDELEVLNDDPVDPPELIDDGQEGIMKEQSLTDETKAIMLQLEQLKNRRVELTNELTSVDDQIDELQRMLISERKRTSSVSDNIRVFEGLAEPQRNIVSRSQSMIPSPKHPSSYTHLWHLSEKNGDDEVVIPDDLVMIQPNRTLPSSIKMSGIPSRDSKPRVNSDKVALKIGSYDELTSSQVPPQICSNLQARSHGSSKSISSIEEPIYVNAMIYKTMDEVIAETGHDTDDSVADIIEQSDDEIADENDDSVVCDGPGSFSIEDERIGAGPAIDHIKVRNLQEASMYSKRHFLAKNLLETEQKYFHQLRALERVNSSFRQNIKAYKNKSLIKENECQIIFFRIPDLTRNQNEIVKKLTLKLRDWSTDSTFTDIIWLIKENLKLYEEYINNYTRARTLLEHLIKTKQGDRLADLLKVSITETREKDIMVQDLLYKPVDRMTHHISVLDDIIRHTPSTHNDYDKLRSYQSEFWRVLATVNKGHVSKGTRKVQEKEIIKSGYVTEEISDTEKKLRYVILSNEMILCVKPTNLKKREIDVKWFIPLNNVNVQLRETKEQISMAKKTRMNQLDKEIVELNQEISKLDPKKDRRKRNKFQDALQKKKIDRLKISQTVPLEIKNCQDGKEMKPHSFMFSSEYERAVWTEEIHSAQRKNTGRINITNYDIKDLIEKFKIEGPPASVPESSMKHSRSTYLNGYLSVTVNQASGFQKDSNAWVAIETDFYGSFTTQARTRIQRTKADSNRKHSYLAEWKEEFEIDANGCVDLVALVLNNQPCGDGSTSRDILVAKGELRLPAVCGLVEGESCPVRIETSGGIDLMLVFKYVSRETFKKRVKNEKNSQNKVFDSSLRVLTAKEGRNCPLIVKSCITEIENRGMEDVGLYRVSGAKSDIDEIKRYFEENHPDLSEKLARVDTHAVTGCMKRFFMDLREPLIPHPYADKLFKLDLVNSSGEDTKLLILDALAGLPVENQGTLHALLLHLRKVAAISENKMDLPNLSIVFGPSLIAAEEVSSGINPIDAIQIRGNILLAILEMEDFPSPSEQLLDNSSNWSERRVSRSRPTQSVMSPSNRPVQFPIPAPRSTCPR